MPGKVVKILIIWLFEFLILSIGAYYFYQKLTAYRSQQRVETTTVLNRDHIVATASANLKWFYELQPSSSEEASPKWLEKPVTYHYNSAGFHDTSEYSLEKPSGVFRIVALGDSFTFGQYLNTKENWTEKLEELLNASSKNSLEMCGVSKFEVINLGMPGYDLPYIVERYKRHGSHYQPDLVTWLESGSGFQRHNEFLRPILEQCDSEQIEKNADEKMTNYVNCWSLAEKKTLEEYPPEKMAEYLLPYWNDMTELVEPGRLKYYTFETEQEKYAFPFWKAKYSQYEFLPIVPYLSDENRLKDWHPNAKGQEIIATTIFQDLKTTVLAKCFSEKK